MATGLLKGLSKGTPGQQDPVSNVMGLFKKKPQ